MFGSKKRVTLIEESQQTKETTEGIKFKSMSEIMSLFCSPIVVADIDCHYEKLLSLKGNHHELIRMENIRKKYRFLLDNDVKFKISPDAVKSFKYCATIYQRGTPYQNTPAIQDDDLKERIVYEGDLPEFVIDRLSILKDNKDFGFDVATIHSNEPLSVRYEPIVIDPVVIVWACNPNICISKGVVSSVASYSEGYVVAVWNELGKEI